MLASDDTYNDLESARSRLDAALSDLNHCLAAAELFPFRAGDHVKHAPTGETWVLACDQVGNDVIAAGWPETIAKATHCRLVKPATDEERLEMLRYVAKGSGFRASRARGQLAKEQETT